MSTLAPNTTNNKKRDEDGERDIRVADNVPIDWDAATVMNPYKMDNRMHKIELGMTKQKVISILGKDFESAGARITPDGPIESISYKTVTMTIADYSEGYYILSFKNGILVEWFKEKTPINNNTAN